MADLDRDFTVWTIYEQPKDFPGGFVVRPWTITGHGPEPGAAFVAATLEEARGIVPPGLTWMDRAPDDDGAIVETWI
jgi:hypothetical protein